MRAVLLMSRWFYPANISLLTWLSLGFLLAFVAVVGGWVLRGVWRKIAIYLVAALCGAGAIVCLGLTTAEIVIFRFSAPLSIAGYAALLIVFIGLRRQSRSEHPLKLQCARSFVLASVAFAYLFFYGEIPDIQELPANELAGVEGVNVLGRSTGTLPITEFADFECPPCAAQDRNMDRLWVTYSDRIRYSFRHFPKPRHPHAEPAALASQCAAEYGAFWETKRLLFSSQSRLGEILAHPELPTLPSGAIQSYAQCVQTRSAWPSVSKDRQWAQDLGLRVTPSIIIGNKLIQGVVSYARLELIVRRELSERKLSAPKQTTGRSLAACGSPLATQACSE